MTRAVRTVAGIDYKRLPLTPAEGAVFAKILGVASASEVELVRATGFHADSVASALDRLLTLRAIELFDGSAPTAVAPVAGAASPGRAAIGPAFGGLLGSGLPHDAAALAEDVDLEGPKRIQILEAAQLLERLNHYDLLGVHPTSDRKDIKAAYYAIAPEFHPDKYFKRKLGSFKGRIEAIFTRLTTAHDTLTSKERRAQYDATLLASGHPVSSGGVLRSAEEARVEAERLAEEKRQRELEAKRRLLATKLGGVGGPKRPAGPPPGTGTPPPGVAPLDARAAAEALRVRMENAKLAAQRVQVERHVLAGRASLAQGDYAAAANSFRIAAQLAPDNDALQQEALDVLQKSAVELADSFIRQGELLSREERWEEAALAFAKAVHGRPNDPALVDRAARVTHKSGIDPRRAMQLARRAVELAPNVIAYRLTLAVCLAVGGFRSSAESQLEAATKLGARDANALAMIETTRNEVAKLLVEFEAMSRLAASAAQETVEAPAAEYDYARGAHGAPEPTSTPTRPDSVIPPANARSGRRLSVPAFTPIRAPSTSAFRAVSEPSFSASEFAPVADVRPSSLPPPGDSLPPPAIPAAPPTPAAAWRPAVGAPSVPPAPPSSPHAAPVPPPPPSSSNTAAGASHRAVPPPLQPGAGSAPVVVGAVPKAPSFGAPPERADGAPRAPTFGRPPPLPAQAPPPPPSRPEAPAPAVPGPATPLAPAAAGRGAREAGGYSVVVEPRTKR
jgi:curved DNA-binding protein CbpA